MNTTTQIKLILIVWVIVVLAIASVAAKEKAVKTGSVNASHDASSSGDSLSRMREGSTITDELGEFQIAADRFNFYLQNEKRAIRVLENLSLERVARTLENDPSPRLWSVSGVMMEFRGENYLLITRAVLKPRAIPTIRTPDKDNADEKGEAKPAK